MSGSRVVGVWVGSARVTGPTSGLVPLATDRGLTLGDGLFETLRLLPEGPRFLDRHLARLRAGARRTGLAVPERLDACVESVVLEADGLDGALRITLTRGPGGGLHPPDGGESTLVVEARPWAPDPAWTERGVVAAELPWRWSPGPLAGLKSTSWAHQVEAARWARDRGADEGLWRDPGGHWVEGTTSNLFVRVDGVLRTAPLSSGCLPGIMRAHVLDEARRRGEPVDDATPLEGDVLDRADEVFLTNSLRGRVGVAQVLRVEDPPM